MSNDRGGAATDTRPILIFGAPRSGTSLLSRLLDAHSRIAIPFESHLFNQWVDRIAAYGDLGAPDNQRRLIDDIIRFGVVHDWTPRPDPDAVAALVAGPGFAGVARAIMEWAAQAEGKPRWGEKTPHHTLLHDEVLKAWPDALVVMIYRDPRDVALSWKQARFGGNHVMPFAQSWAKYMAACTAVGQRLAADRCCAVRYETLVNAPEAELTRIMAFLGETYEPAQLSFHRGGEDWKTDMRNEAQLRKPISPDSIGRWKTGLSPREVRIIESAAGPMMDQYGYARAAPDAALPGPMKLRVRYVEQPVQRGLGLFKNARGFVYLWRDLNWKLRRRVSGPFGSR